MITKEQARQALAMWDAEYVGQNQRKLWLSCLKAAGVPVGRLNPSLPLECNGNPVDLVGYLVARKRSPTWTQRWAVDLDGDGQTATYHVRNRES